MRWMGRMMEKLDSGSEDAGLLIGRTKGYWLGKEVNVRKIVVVGQKVQLLLNARDSIVNFMAVTGMAFAAISLGGCVAAVPLLPYAIAATQGFHALKLYQLSSGGEVKVEFSSNSITVDDKRTLVKLKRLAILADQTQGKTLGILADEIRNAGLYEVATPYEVEQALSKTNERLTPSMTERERRMVYAKLAERTKSDAIFVMEGEGYKFESNSYSLDAPETSMSYTLRIYSPSTQRDIWNQQMKTVVTGNPASQEKSQREIEGIIVKAIRDKLLEVAGRKPA